MALIDLNKDLARINAPAPSTSATPPSSRRNIEPPTYADDHTERELTAMVLKLLGDPIAEVKNMTVTWWAVPVSFTPTDGAKFASSLGAMVRKARPLYLTAIVNDLLSGLATSDKENEENEGRRDISCLGESGGEFMPFF
jgi:hypothetical protein